MNYPPRPAHRREKVVVSADHDALTNSAMLHLFTPSAPFVVTRVVYSNSTGLAENSSNSFAITVSNQNSPLVVADFTFTGEADDDLCTATAHGLLTGDGPIRVANSGGALPTGLAAATDYWIIKASADTFSLATSFANAIAGTAINLTGDGSGTQTLSDTASTSRVLTIASGIDTDSDGAGTNTLVAGDTVMTVTAANALVESGQRIVGIFTEGGTATLPAGRIVVEGYYL